MKSFKFRNVLIAGGTGLLGTNLTEKMSVFKKMNLQSSYLTTKPPKHLKKFYKKYNFLNWKDCIKSTKKKDLVIICAVKAGGIKFMKKNPTKSMTDNLAIRSNLFEACKINNVKKVIWISSSTAYPIKKKPIKEFEMNYDKKTYDEYIITGWVYRFLEKLAEFYLNKKKLNINIIRVSNIYGPYDNFSENFSHVIPSLIKKIIYKNKVLKVWGNKSVIRDFVFVEDLVEAIISISLLKKNISPINFSSGNPTTIWQLTNLLLGISKKKLKVVFSQKKLSSAQYRVLDNAKFNKIFRNFKRTSLKSGLQKTFKWYKENEKKR